MIYQWGSRSYSVDAQVVGEFIETVAKENGVDDLGLCPADALVEAARPEDTAIHDLFDWDVDRCAHRDLLRQARRLTHSVVRVEILPSGDERKTPAFVPVRVESDGKVRQGYASSVDVAARSELKAQVVRDCVASLRGWRKRLDSLEGLEGATLTLDAAIEQLTDE